MPTDTFPTEPQPGTRIRATIKSSNRDVTWVYHPTGWHLILTRGGVGTTRWTWQQIVHFTVDGSRRIVNA